MAGRLRYRVGVGPRRGADLAVGPFPRPALRTGRATLAASGSPRAHADTHRCSFVCIASTRCSAASRSGHGAPIFTGDLLVVHGCCELAGPLRHVAGFPGLRLLRVLRPIPAASTDDGPSRRPAGSWPVRGPPGWFPRSLSNRSTGEVPSYAPAASPRVRRRPSPWPPRSATSTDRGVLRTDVRMRAAAQPRSARFELVDSLERRSVAGSSRTPSRLACRTRTI